jgi:hypothetical protein
MDWWLAVLLKPFAALVFFLFVWLIARVLHGLIPEGKAKRLLYSPLPWLRKKE